MRKASGGFILFENKLQFENLDDAYIILVPMFVTCKLS